MHVHENLGHAEKKGKQPSSLKNRKFDLIHYVSDNTLKLLREIILAPGRNSQAAGRN